MDCFSSHHYGYIRRDVNSGSHKTRITARHEKNGENMLCNLKRHSALRSALIIYLLTGLLHSLLHRRGDALLDRQRSQMPKCVLQPATKKSAIQVTTSFLACPSGSFHSSINRPSLHRSSKIRELDVAFAEELGQLGVHVRQHDVKGGVEVDAPEVHAAPDKVDGDFAVVLSLSLSLKSRFLRFLVHGAAEEEADGHIRRAAQQRARVAKVGKCVESLGADDHLLDGVQLEPIDQ